MKKTDYLIIGSGIAGLSTAFLLSKLGSVLVISKGKMKQANTYWAQGGVAAVIEKGDTFTSHINDTLSAGAGHCNEAAVRYMVENGPKAYRFLKSIGVDFEEKPYLEAGHSRPRVWRSSDFCGQDILDQLIKVCKKEPNITLEEDADACELIVHDKECRGAFIRYGENTETEPVLAKNVILASGGCGHLFGRTTNTKGSAGDGLALAVNAGLELSDMEFIQFHPTAFDKDIDGRYFLLSEALRGFGAKVVDHRGEPFLEKYDKRGELAPRDLLARAVYFEKNNGPVYLDMRHFEEKEIRNSFPNIFKRMKEHGFDLSKNLVPITPVAHYACGGIPVDLKGATQLPGLYSVGEVARTGVHGANRLASNSLLEAVVFSKALADTLEKARPLDEAYNVEIKDLEPEKVIVEELNQVKAYAARIGQVMWENVSIVRTREGLEKAKKEIIAIPARDYRIQHRQLVCFKIIEACLARPQSLGCHYIAEEIA